MLPEPSAGPVDPRSPLEWTDDDESRPFEISAWRALGADVLSPRTMSRHFLILGETGSGKTKSAIMPIVQSAMRYRVKYPEVAPAMLVIDPKFELAHYVRSFERVPVIMIDPAEPSKRIWLFEGRHAERTPRAVLEYALRCCSAAWVESASTRDPYWRNAGYAIVQCFVAADMLRTSRERPLWDVLFERATDRVRAEWNQIGLASDREQTNYYENAYTCLSHAMATSDYSIVAQFLDSARELGVPSPGIAAIGSLFDMADSQRSGETGEAIQFLRDLADASLNAVIDLRPPPLTNVERQANLSVKDSIETGKIVIFSPDSNAPVNDIIGRTLKTKFFEAAFRRGNKLRPVFYVCDEFHRFVTADPESGEQSFLDRCRAYRVVCALATQSIASLRNGLEMSATNASGNVESTLGIILGNTGNKLIFRNTDSDTQDKIQKFIPRSPTLGDLHVLEVHPLASLSPGMCYYLFADGKVGRAAVALEGFDSNSVRHHRVPRIRLIKPFTVEEILSACDRVDSRLNYYWEHDLEFEIDSPGGETPALDYLLGRMDHWRGEGSRIRTLGLTSVASAAAFVLSMGSIGFRRAFAGCRILYHDARVSPPANTEITRQAATVLADMLKKADAQHVARLADYLFGDVGLPKIRRTINFDHPQIRPLDLGYKGEKKLTEKSFIKVFERLTEHERFISAEQATLLGLIDKVVAWK